MKQIFILLGCLTVIVGMIPLSHAQVLSPHIHLEMHPQNGSIPIFIGETSFSGVFFGYPTESFIDLSAYEAWINLSFIEETMGLTMFDNLYAFPLLGSTYFKDVDRVTIVNTKIFENGEISPEKINDILNSISQFSHVDILTENGPCILGTDGSSITVNTRFPSAVSSIAQTPFETIQEIPMLFLLTSSSLSMSYTGNESLLMPFSENTSIVLLNQNGETIWNEATLDTIFFIQDNNFSLTHNAPVHVFPLLPESSTIEATLQVSPAPVGAINLVSLLDTISNLSQSFGDSSLSFFPSDSQNLADIFSIASSVLNGGMVLINNSDDVLIDHSKQQFTGFGFARGTTYTVSVTGEPLHDVNVKVSGDYKLVFLGDHFYTSAAKDDDHGVGIPLFPVILWIAAIALFLLFKFYIKRDVNELLDSKIKRFAFVFHMGALIITFILMDREISYQFGSSFIDVLLGQGISLIAGVFAGIQLILWCLGYVACSIPVYIIVNKGLQFVGIQKGGKGIGKGIGILFIWVFTALYATLIVNILLLILNPQMFLPVR